MLREARADRRYSTRFRHEAVGTLRQDVDVRKAVRTQYGVPPGCLTRAAQGSRQAGWCSTLQQLLRRGADCVGTNARFVLQYLRITHRDPRRAQACDACS